ncbi:hypothetical protein HDU76_007526 [Blyttiomyces sp. JEL0837]|nr:hypothetical protein HDU76_007526 [Blyttiomyces sp. JEL0837]
MAPKKKASAPAVKSASSTSTTSQQTGSSSITTTATTTSSSASTPKSQPVETSNASIGPDSSAQDVADDDAPVEELTGTAGQASKDMQNMSSFLDQATGSVDESAVGKAMAFLSKVSINQKAQKATREKELAKIPASKEDIEVLMAEMDMTKLEAEKALKEHKGSLEETLRALVAV